MALERDDVELVAVNDPFITTDYMVRNHVAFVWYCVAVSQKHNDFHTKKPAFVAFEIRAKKPLGCKIAVENAEPNILS